MSSRVQQFSSRCRGALLGSAFGDVLGAPVEGWPAARIATEYGSPPDSTALFAADSGRYTDDTQMLLATLRSLLRSKGVDGADCGRACAEAFDPARRYGRSATAVLEAVRGGVDPRQTARLLFPQGSWGNGAAMRIAPVGLFCGHLPAAELRVRVAEAVCFTHDHSEAVDAALVLAMTVGRFSRLAAGQPVDGSRLLTELAEACIDATMHEALLLAAELLQQRMAIPKAAARLGNGVRSSEAVPLALYVAFSHLDAPMTAILAAVGCGGDSDTVAAMTGAIVGARHGDDCFAKNWHHSLEPGTDGYDALAAGGDALAMKTVEAGLFVDFYRGIG